MVTSTPSVLSAAQARRIALAAQGFGTPRPATVTPRRIRAVINQLGLLQLDSVNVLIRSHYLPLFARLGPYPRESVDVMARHAPSRGGRELRELIEYWAHEASLIPVTTHPLLRWRMADAAEKSWGGVRRIAREQPDLIDTVRQLVAQSGPLRSSEVGVPRRDRRPGQMWNWHDGKIALEYLFWAGEVGATERVNFERRYDLIERVLPTAISAMPTPDRADAQRELVRIAARAYGVATEPELGDYFRLPRLESKARVAELVDAGELIEVTVSGWNCPAYLWPAARQPRSVQARALLSPFDPLIWFRPRALRLFDFHYRIGIYTPASQRTHGYYVLPFLLGDRLVARVDLKSDRRAQQLVVQSAWAEQSVDHDHVAAELAAELRLLATWLGLADVRVADGATAVGDLSPTLHHHLELTAVSCVAGVQTARES